MIKLLLLLAIAHAEPLKVLMIDAGPPLATKYYGDVVGKDLSNTIKPTHFHATASYKFIMSGDCRSLECLKPVCKAMVVDWCGYLDKGGAQDKSYYNCLNKAVEGNYDIVNMSLSGPGIMPKEEQLLKTLGKRSLIIIAAGNSSLPQREYPAGYSTSVNGPIIATSAVDDSGVRLSSSNYDNLTVDFLGNSYYYDNKALTWKFIQGTSVAAALYTHKLIKEMCPSRKGRFVNGKED